MSIPDSAASVKPRFGMREPWRGQENSEVNANEVERALGGKRCMRAMINIGLYGNDGHQLPVQLPEGVRARVTAVAGYPSASLEAVREYADLAALLADPEISLVSLCSPRRCDQAADAIQCLRAGKHVLAEKPAAFSPEELEMILAAARDAGRKFHEMADSFLEPPVLAMRRLVDAGALGTIVHVQAHKSYPWHDARPQDLLTDGGLIRQVGIHATRFIIGATGLKITAVTAAATGLGNPGDGAIHLAAVFAFTLDNGAVASMNLNYLNPQNFGSWGNEHLRVFGTRGMAESVDGFRRHRLYLNGQEPAELPLPDPPVSTSFIEHYVNHLLDGTPIPVAYDEEIAALRAVIAAHDAAVTGRRITI